MLFNSLEFAIFFPVVFLLYWFVFNRTVKIQNTFLMIVSYIFYGWWDWRFLALLTFSALCDFFLGLALGREERQPRRKLYLIISMTVNLTMLGFFKYYNFFVSSFVDAFTFFGSPIEGSHLNIILPVGISFYTFQSMSYGIDIYRRKLAPTRDIIEFLAFVSFFPQLVAGPIERAVHMLPQFYTARKFDPDQAIKGLRLMIWGFFKKVVIADNCALVVNDVFNSYQSASGLEIVTGIVFFAFQIYGDFSGYTDIALGAARLLGFELMDNFKTPYFSRDIAEFWRRWHISLTTWFRDYVYIPLGGSRGKLSLTVRNTIIVFLVSGFWHGANWTFVVWGLINALYFLPLLIFDRTKQNSGNVAAGKLLPSVKELFQMSLTFVLTCIAWTFFRSENIHQSITMLTSIFEPGFFGSTVMSIKFYIFPMIIFWLVVDWITRENGVQNIQNKKIGVAFDIVTIVLLILFGAFNNNTFIYFQF